MNKPIDEPLYQHRPVSDRRNTVTNLILSHPEASNRRIARVAVVSREMVGKIRRELIRKSKIESRHALHRVGADGKTYTLPKPKEQRCLSTT